jgi:hypothetical protein
MRLGPGRTYAAAPRPCPRCFRPVTGRPARRRAAGPPWARRPVRPAGAMAAQTVSAVARTAHTASAMKAANQARIVM